MASGKLDVVGVIRRIRASRLASPDGGIWQLDRSETAPTEKKAAIAGCLEKGHSGHRAGSVSFAC